MIGVTPHVWLGGRLVTGKDVLPVAFSKLTEIKVVDFAKLAIAFLVADHSFDQVLLRKVHALELVEQADVSKVSVGRAR